MGAVGIGRAMGIRRAGENTVRSQHQVGGERFKEGCRYRWRMKRARDAAPASRECAAD
jgi:hypothetical protein